MRGVDPIRLGLSRVWAGESSGIISTAATAALAPAEALFGFAVAVRNTAFDRGALRTESAPIPVVSVGNLRVGGTGKTPFCNWIAARLRERGERPAIVLRGYGEDEVAVHRTLNPGMPVIAAKRRIEGVRTAAAEGATCAVLDDGFQHRRLARDVDLVLVAAEGWGASHHLLPRGPYREPITSLGRASQVFVVRKSADLATARAVVGDLREGGIAAPVGIVHLGPDGVRPLAGSSDGGVKGIAPGQHVLAVTSLATPRAFIEQLHEIGLETDHLAYPDHHEFDAADIRAIVSKAGGAPVVMTLKEAVKLKDHWPTGVPAFVLHQRVTVEEGLQTLDELLSIATASSR